jgi:hypothetical protein
MSFTNQRPACFAIVLFVVALATPSFAKRVDLLHGEFSLDVPSDVSPAKDPRKASDNYENLDYLASSDRRFTVEVTYGKHDLDPSQLSAFLKEKVIEYGKGRTKLPRFRWLKHTLIKRDGRQWVDISFAHGVRNSATNEVYTRCLSCIAHRHLLEIWVVSHRMPNPREKALVDRVVESIRLSSEASADATNSSNQAIQRTAPQPVFPLRVATTFNWQPCALSGAVADLGSR